MLSVSAPGDETALVAAPLESVATAVIGRHVFYNNSRFDGGNPAPTPSDDAAIAVDKQALLPGQTATFANYTSYASGVNGLMIDIREPAGVPTVSDFLFRVGNNNNQESWALAPAPAGYSVRSGGGLDGSTRITITWPDGLIKNEWLQVTVRATPNTGLAERDVSYFGSAVGETGNVATNAITNASDRVLTRLHPHGLTNPAPITSAYDFDRDALVNQADEIIARSAYNGQGGILRLITASHQLGPDDAPVDASPASAPSAGAPAFVDFVSADVVGRSVFYNHSQFDGTNPTANAADDAAIALDKRALLPGQTATMANYTSYSRGLNGILVDIDGLSGTPTPDDFEFRTGNSADPSTWTAAPEPLLIAVRHAAGVGGSDRVTITWPDNALENTWLQVTVKASPNTGLKRPDVFYFGNLIGDSGANSAQPVVNATDRLAARNGPHSLANPASITSVVDYNRDSLVNMADELIALLHVGMPVFRWLAAPPAETVLEPTRPGADFVHWGDGGYYSAYAPTLIRAVDGTLLFFSEGRWGGSNDATSFAIVMRRSFDNGVSWTPLTAIFSVPSGTVDVGVPTAVVDEQTGELFVLFTKDNDLVFVMSSTDSGLSWSIPRDVTLDVKVTAQGNPNPAAFPDEPWGWYAVGTGHGIQLQNGPRAGRLLITADHRLSGDLSGTSWSHVIYSDDHGQTWHLGGGLDQTNPVNDYSNENTLAEGSDGSIYMSIRINNRPVRGSSRSFDGGMTWSNMQEEASLITSPVHASLLRVNENTVLFSAPDATDAGHLHDGTRQKMTIWVSHDNMATWVKGNSVFYGYASYSDMVLVSPDTVLLVFNGGRDNLDWVKHVYLMRFNLRWLETPDDYQFIWHFNEKEPGRLTELGGPSIFDRSLWDNRAVPRADSAAEAPRYVAAPDGHTALRLTSGSDHVMLTPLRTRALQFEATESFTVEATIRTSDSSGIIIGSRDGAAGWTLELVDGRVRFKVDDLLLPSAVTSAQSIDDGNWHRITALRNAATHQLTLIIDGADFSGGPDNTMLRLWADEPVLLGAAASGSQQLAFDIDVLRVTRRALLPGEWLPAGFAEPPRDPAPDYGSDAPNTIGGLEFWLPAYDPAHYFADFNFADPLPATPAAGTAVHSAIDASTNRFHAKVAFDTRQVLYAVDPEVGPSWRYDTAGPSLGHPWIVDNSSGASPNNFDFVQNTGVFTISTFVKAGASSAPMTLFDNTAGTLANGGFSLTINEDGSLGLYIVGPNSTLRLNDTSAPGLIARDVWYHVAAVGNGPGRGVTYYVTPVSNSTVTAYGFGSGVSGPNVVSPSVHNLYIGSRADPYRNGFNGQMVDQALYNRALSAAEIQLLFDYTRQD